MAHTGLAQFDETIHITNIWLKELNEDLGWDGHHRAYRALRATLHALRDRLAVDASAHLAARPPMLVRGIDYEGWSPAQTPGPERTVTDFITPVVAAFAQAPDEEPERIVKVVFRVLSRHVLAGEVQNILHSPPEHIRVLWDRD